MKTVMRRPRLALTPTVWRYSAATGATAGSIIAVIIDDHMARNGTNAMPIVPAPFPMSLAYAMTPAHASAVIETTATRWGVSRNDGRSYAAAGEAAAVTPTRRTAR